MMKRAGIFILLSILLIVISACDDINLMTMAMDGSRFVIPLDGISYVYIYFAGDYTGYFSPGKLYEFTITIQYDTYEYIEGISSAEGLVWSAAPDGGTTGTATISQSGVFSADSGGYYIITATVNGATPATYNIYLNY
ncbi:MAG: hypothetical protein JW904_14805 [Spirochaetales bacterium]|nr:hypothetical protein [Spirochaetales bacterium]